MGTLATSTRVFRLLVGLKGDDAGAYAVEEGIRIAQRIPGASLQLVHVMSGAPDVRAIADRAGHLRLYVDEKIASLGGFSSDDVSLRVSARAGDPVDVLGRWANEHGTNLVVLGSPARHLVGWNRTHVAERLADVVTCPIVVAGPESKHGRASLAREAAEPSIEPPCHDCVETRFASNGATWWCDRHDHHGRSMLRPHAFSYQRELPLSNRDRQVFLA